MNKNFSATAVFFLMAVLWGCGPTEHIPPPSTEEVCRLASFAYDSDGKPAVDYYEYDDAGRLVTVHHTGGWVTYASEISYNSQGDIQKIEGNATQEFAFTKDGQGRIIKMKETYIPIGQNPTTKHYIFEYDNQDNLTGIVEIPGNKTGFETLYKGNWDLFVFDAAEKILSGPQNDISLELFWLERTRYNRMEYDYPQRKATDTFFAIKVPRNGAITTEAESVISYFFDGKKTPYNTPTLEMYLLAAEKSRSSSLGNIIEHDQDQIRQQVVYEYNEHGFPTKASLAANGLSTPVVGWSYKCNQ